MTTDFVDLLARHDYAIIDRTIIGAEEWHDELPMQDIAPKSLAGDIERAPKLLPLETGAPYMDWLAENMAGACQGDEEYLFSCLLAVPGVPAKKIMFHLERHLVFASPQGQGILRYYDGRVFPHLLRILDAYSLRALFGPVERWTVRLQDDWFNVPRPEAGIARALWSLGKDTRERLDTIMQINQTLDQWQRRHKRPWKSLDEFQAFSEQVERALEIAQNELGLQDAEAQNDFALQRLEADNTDNWRNP
jgi:hypothetical protein